MGQKSGNNDAQRRVSSNPLGLKDHLFGYDFFPASKSSKVFTLLADSAHSFFVSMRVSANIINTMALMLTVWGAFVLVSWGSNGLALGIGAYFLAIFLNRCAMQTSLQTGTTTFFTLFWDRFSRTLGTAVLRSALVWLAYMEYSFGPLFWFGAICLMLTPYNLFLHDRYSTFARWINEEKGKRINPSAGIEKFYHKIFLVEDIERAALILSLVWFAPAILVYFLVNIILQVSTITYYFQLAYANMRVSNYEISAARV